MGIVVFLLNIIDLMEYTKDEIKKIDCELLLVYGNVRIFKGEYLSIFKDYFDQVFFMPQIKHMISEEDKSLLNEFEIFYEDIDYLSLSRIMSRMNKDKGKLFDQIIEEANY